MTFEEFWQKKSDLELELATMHIAEYTEEVQQVIRAEAKERGMTVTPVFRRSIVQRDTNLLGNLLERSRLDRFDTPTSNNFLERIVGIIGKIAALVCISLSVALLVASGRLILPLIIVGSLLYCLYRAIAYRNCHLLIYEQGVVYEQPNKKQVAYYDELQIWQSITQVYLYGFIPVGRRSEQYILQFPEGERVTTFQESIGKKLHMMVTQQQLPQVLEAYHQDNNVLFDSAICLNKKSISVNGEFVKWSDVKYVDVTRGTIYVYKTGSPLAVASILVSEVPNVYVFLNLLEGLGYYKP